MTGTTAAPAATPSAPTTPQTEAPEKNASAQPSTPGGSAQARAFPGTTDTKAKPAAPKADAKPESAPQRAAPAKEAPQRNAPPSADEEMFEFEEKVNGKPEKRRYTKAQLQARLQKESAVEVRMEQVAKEQARLRAFAEAVSKDPEKALREFGVDPDKFAEDRVLSRYEREQLAKTDPRALEMLEMKEKLDRYESEKKQSESKQAEAARKAQIERANRKLESSATKTLEILGFDREFAGKHILPEVLSVYDRMLSFADPNDPDDLGCTPEEAADLVREKLDFLSERRFTSTAPEEIIRNIQPRLASLPPAQLVDALGPDLIRAIIDEQIARTERPAPRPTPATTPKRDPLPAPTTDAERRSFMGVRERRTPRI